MELDYRNAIESVLRWIHVIAGITWIGHLYFFNWVNANFAGTMDAETKKKVVPELIPRALYFFRWGAAYTWISGFILAVLVYYMNTAMLFDERPMNPVSHVMFTLTWVGFFIYDQLMKRIKDAKVQAVVGWVLASGFVMTCKMVAGLSYRGASIHLGMLFGTMMAMNVWMRIWPAQRKIIAGIRDGQAVDAAIPALAGQRSKHNTYMSVPLVFLMLSQHGTWAASMNSAFLPAIVAVSWLATMWIYNKSKADSVKAI